jgi:hypothetical protein
VVFVPPLLKDTEDTNMDSQNQNDATAAQERAKLRKMLTSGQKVKVTPGGKIVDPKDSAESSTQNAITIPPGKLASFYWYENNTALLTEEKRAMSKFFPQFELAKLTDGRLYWHGYVDPGLYPDSTAWYLQAIYDHNHPHNKSYGGSVKVYSIQPDLDVMVRQAKIPIPHLLRDHDGHVYLCTARPEDIKAGNIATSAASSLAWAMKWISSFELYLAGDLALEVFGAHGSI